jgi:PHP family Zn ribbon phosphoesterase
MTPNNIINMAVLKGLDFIAVTDHNTAGNLAAVQECAKGKDIVVIPGIELETAEEIHLVCLFPSVEEAEKAGDIIFKSLPDIKNRREIFGIQYLMNERDEITGEMEQLLLTATSLTIEDSFRITRAFGGVVIPAHINRTSYSIMSNLGSIPDNLGIKYVEIAPGCEYEVPSGYLPFLSSDAHTLGDILERTSFLELPDKTIESLLTALRQDDGAI